MDDVSAASCYHQAAVFHHPSGGHKERLGLICPFEKNIDTPFACNRKLNMTVNRSYLKKRVLVPHKKHGICDKSKAGPNYNPQTPKGSALGVRTVVF